MYCDNCGLEFLPNAKYCTRCGEKNVNFVFNKHPVENDEDSAYSDRKYCEKCGLKLNSSNHVCSKEGLRSQHLRIMGKKEESKDGSLKKGIRVKTMKTVAVFLYFLQLFIVIVMAVVSVAKFGIMPELDKSSFLYITLFFIINLLSDKRSDKKAIMPWYKSKWGWFVLLMIVPLLILPLVFASAILSSMLFSN